MQPSSENASGAEQDMMDRLPQTLGEARTEKDRLVHKDNDGGLSERELTRYSVLSSIIGLVDAYMQNTTRSLSHADEIYGRIARLPHFDSGDYHQQIGFAIGRVHQVVNDLEGLFSSDAVKRLIAQISLEEIRERILPILNAS